MNHSIYQYIEKQRKNPEIWRMLNTQLKPAVDCQVNRNNNQFFTDTDFSRRCNYRKCDFTCDGISTDLHFG